MTIEHFINRRDPDGSIHRKMGHVVSCNGSRTTIATNTVSGELAEGDIWTVGKLVSIDGGRSRIVALVYSIHTRSGTWEENADNLVLVEAELLGEVRTTIQGRIEFTSGVSAYPPAGATVHRIRSSDLAAVYANSDGNHASVGKLSQDVIMDAKISIDKMLSRHFAVVGTTGVGKSTAVALLLRKSIERRGDLRVLILDPHNEYAKAFGEAAFVVDTETLDLPFWLFRLEEFSEVLFRGRPGIPEEMDFLRDLIPEAKRAFRGSVEGATPGRFGDRKTAITADTPLPYRIADLIALLDNRIGRLEGREEKPHLKMLKSRIMGALNDPRYRFMFSSNTIHDTILDTIGSIFRIPGDGKPITVFQLAGIPSEVVNSVASVLCRMAFDIALWGSGNIRILVVCEEAHRYIPANEMAGFFPTRQAIARIAKEGRKYGISLGIVTQRPGELDPTILSQCSTVFAMRLANEKDQEIIKSAIPNSSISTTSFLSSIGNREAIAFGDAVTVPMRMQFVELEAARIPQTASAMAEHGDRDGPVVDLKKIVQRMRHTVSDEPVSEDDIQSGLASANGIKNEASATAHSTGRDTLYVFESAASPAADAEALRLRAMMRLEERKSTNQGLKVKSHFDDH